MRIEVDCHDICCSSRISKIFHRGKWGLKLLTFLWRSMRIIAESYKKASTHTMETQEDTGHWYWLETDDDRAMRNLPGYGDVKLKDMDESIIFALALSGP